MKQKYVCSVIAVVLSLVMFVFCGFGLMLNVSAAQSVGDFNKDDVVDSDDAIYLLYHTLFGEQYYPIEASGDIDADGKVDSDDAVYLLYHTIDSETYPLPDDSSGSSSDDKDQNFGPWIPLS